MTLAILTILGAAVLAFANGANDVSKGVATLAGSGRTSYRSAITWGTWWTLAGGLASLVVSVELVNVFTSAIVAPDVLALAAFPLAVAIGASVWVIFASITGLPVSTTHALTGAIVGVAWMAGGVGSVRWWMLLSIIALPLALSPLVSAVIGYGMHVVAARISPTCICVENDISPSALDGDGAATAVLAPQIVTCSVDCAAAHGGWRVMPADALHWGASAALSFARGLNDNAKLAAMAALGFTAVGGPLWLAFLVCAAAMTLGSYVAGLRVTRTLGERVVHMDRDTGLAAALVPAGLVLAASFYALPVSTTHVSTGAIVGAGVRQGGDAVEWSRVGSLLMAWIVTLPIAAAAAAGVTWLWIVR